MHRAAAMRGVDNRAGADRALTVDRRLAVHDDRAMPKTPVLMSSREVCDQLGIVRTTLMQWVAAGRVTPVHRAPGRNGAMVFASADVDRLAAEMSEGATS